MEIAPDLQIRVLDLETLIATKEEAGRDKDLAVLPTLRATLDEIRKRNAEIIHHLRVRLTAHSRQ